MSSDVALRLVRLRRMTANGEARALRQNAQLSLSEIGASVGVDQATVWKWETNRQKPRGDSALRYEALLAAIAKASAA